MRTGWGPARHPTLAALEGWPACRVGALNEFLTRHFQLPICDGEGLRRAHQFERAGGFDVGATQEVRMRALLGLGWPAGEAPPASRLVYAIVDWLEYNCARDLADEAGEAGDFLLGAGAWTEEFACDVAAMGEADDDCDMASAADAMHHGAA